MQAVLRHEGQKLVQASTLANEREPSDLRRILELRHVEADEELEVEAGGQRCVVGVLDLVWHPGRVSDAQCKAIDPGPH
jgi:hypothetical protein